MTIETYQFFICFKFFCKKCLIFFVLNKRIDVQEMDLK